MTKLKFLLEAHHPGWIGVDLDGTLAHYDHFEGVGIIGEPIPLMVDRVKAWLNQNREVRILTARAASNNEHRDEEIKAIAEWTTKHLGQQLVVTSEKDQHMEALYDDKAVQVVKNQGTLFGDD